MGNEGKVGTEPEAVPSVPGYELGALIARGGSSEVWAGVALDDGRRVAVKVVGADLDAVEAAGREASLSASAADAHVVAVEACVDLPDGRVAVVMPHLLGGSLDALVRARGHLSPGEVVTVLTPVASALGRLHGLGVVHGDVSPGNVLLDLDGRPVLGDLGLGHVLGEVSPGVWGTDGYVAPEVLLGVDPTPSSDVYSLGALGWLCLSGTVPGPPGLRPELAEVCRAVGPAADALVAALAEAVSAHPGDRPSAHDLAWALFGAADPEPLRLVHGDDEVSAVTYRLRAAAVHPTDGGLSRGRRRVRMPRWAGRGGDARRRTARAVRAAEPAWPDRSGATVPAGRGGGPVGWGSASSRSRTAGRPRGRHAAAVARRSAPALTGVALLVPVIVVLLVLAVALPGRDGGTAEARPVTGSSRSDAPSTAPGSDPVLDPHAPRSRAAQLLTVLADARAAAWREAAPGLLVAADAPGSPAAARDAAAVAELRRAGVRYRGLRYSVAEVSTAAATSRRAVLRARVDAGSYTVTGASGSSARPAVPGSPVLVDLVLTDAGWRVSDLRPAP